jgi:gamma-glutamyl-gamma-aminobutyraldehyde dehydrogenase
VLTFTGSTEVGRHFLRYSADSNLKRVYLELGGKSPNIILADAPDLDAAADSAAWAIFFNSGEMCTAGSRLVVHADVADRVVERIVDTSAQWFPADPLRTRKCHWSTSAACSAYWRSRPCRGRLAPLVGGHRCRGQRCLPRTDRGDWGCPDNPCARGDLRPVPAVQVVCDEADACVLPGHAVRTAAASGPPHLGTAHRVSRALRAGTVWVNCYEEGDMAVPFGGVKLSGFGRDKSQHALEEYTYFKTTWIRYG